MAGFIPSSFIDVLLTRVNIVDVISEYVPLKQRGRNHIACCPFHDEKTPSFTVDSAKQFYHCFGCGAGGTAIKFLMEHQRLGFVEAVEKLAERAGLEVPRERGGGDSAASQKYKRMFQSLERMAELYEQQLYKTRVAVQYLKDRGINKETALKFKLGYAPDRFDNVKSLMKDNYNESLLLESGLLSKKESNVYARFRHRLIFPIRDSRGRVIAFGGRAMPSDKEPGAKYLNSPETSLFHKRKTIYGLYEMSKGSKLEKVIVVEGYMDVVSLFQHGIGNAVATLGTAVTRDHIQQLLRICKKLVFCFDGDAAGSKAAVAALKQCLPIFQDGYEIGFMLLPEGEDPDTLVKHEGTDAFNKRIEAAVPLSQFVVDTVCEDLDLSLPEDAASAAERARPLVDSLPKNAFRDLISKRLAAHIDISENQLLTSSSRTKARPQPARAVPRHHFSSIETAAALLINNPSLVEFVLPDEQIDQLQKINHSASALLISLIQQIRTKGVSTANGLLASYQGDPNEDVVNQLRGRSISPDDKPEFDDKAEFKDCMKNIEANLLRRQQEQRIQQLISKKRKTNLSKGEVQEFLALLASNPMR